MKYIYFFLFAILGAGCESAVKVGGNTRTIKEAMEQAYFEGQRDALEGDVRIRKNSDSCWIWTKSCWDDGTQPEYNPSIVCGGDTTKTESND